MKRFKTIALMLIVAFMIMNCSSTSRTTCNGKSYRAGAAELSIWCMWR